ncbi:hypothetical protein [Amycolatopsis nigrescens]|uniref:hypothetical protein n=1 Tax=Amycolatopsis nigrescens TaxID=381445 RepID=UPI00038183B8|nr:hypothetical protein [Amycolatopsis nigrescens]
MTSKRKLLVVLHVLTSVSGVGAVLAELLVLAGAVSQTDPAGQDAALRFAEQVVYSVGIPLLTVGVVVGVLSALTSPWGLFKHTWVLKKLLLTLVNLAVPVLVVGPRVTEVADGSLAAWLVFGGLGVQLLLFVLATVLSVYKPKGRVGAGNRPATRDRAPALSHP